MAAVRLLKADLYSLKQAEDRFEQLLEQVVSILTKQVDPAVVRECAQTLAHSISNSPASLQVVSGCHLVSTQIVQATCVFMKPAS